MFAKIRLRPNVRDPVLYNEKKVLDGKADRILAENFVKDLDEINGRDIMAALRSRVELNDKATRAGLHISLSFETSNHVTGVEMAAAARKYMEKAGLGEQPYVVYMHRDTKAPHCHIVSTTIRPDGHRIEMRDLIF